MLYVGSKYLLNWKYLMDWKDKTSKLYAQFWLTVNCAIAYLKLSQLSLHTGLYKLKHFFFLLLFIPYIILTFARHYVHVE